MSVTRRDFLKYCTISAGAIGLGPAGMRRLEAALAETGAPTVVWLHGSGCQGDSVSFLNRIDADAPLGQRSADEILIESINLAYHTVVMSGTGDTAWSMVDRAKRRGGYVLVLEGAAPQEFGGRACRIAEKDGRDITYGDAIADLAPDAAVVLCVGTCATYGGISAAGSNPAGCISAAQASGRATINIPGCPAHPDWIAWTVVQLILGNDIELDQHGRPTVLFGGNIHDNCPRNPGGAGTGFASSFGQDHLCLEHLGCRGPFTWADCPSRKWNNAANWCIDANAMCIGCVEPDFPGSDIYA